MALSASEILDRALMLSEEMSGSIERAAANYGLTVPRLELLFVLGLQGQCKQVELAAYLDCSPRQVTALVDGLEASGHVERTMSPEDRRVRLIDLTVESRRIVDEVVSARVALAEWLFEGLDDDELQTFGAMSERLISRMSGRSLVRLPEQ
ncbi:MarR family winged helix-turn-helix transcriptional regulator [Dietzia aurantiaca]|uniref:MarR family winged helix-turn-helix transcriptional regulator n=1 Tax=Dietzia aurantiaca TaxID=983873 RepID=UPI001E5DAC74|nr:MarR family transcriptional regulator [Dietzia aurantiaca]